MDDAGNVLIKRLSKCNIYIRTASHDSENAIGTEVLKLPGCALEPEKPFRVNSWIYNLSAVVICLNLAALRHEEIPIQR